MEYATRATPTVLSVAHEGDRCRAFAKSSPRILEDGLYVSSPHRAQRLRLQFLDPLPSSSISAVLHHDDLVRQRTNHLQIMAESLGDTVSAQWLDPSTYQDEPYNPDGSSTYGQTPTPMIPHTVPSACENICDALDMSISRDARIVLGALGGARAGIVNCVSKGGVPLTPLQQTVCAATIGALIIDCINECDR